MKLFETVDILSTWPNSGKVILSRRARTTQGTVGSAHLYSEQGFHRLPGNKFGLLN